MYEEQTYISLVETYKSIGGFFPMEKQFYEVVTGNHYDLKEANKHTGDLMDVVYIMAWLCLS